MSYEFDHEWEHERRRLSKLEGGMDPGTIRHLTQIGVQKGWNCLEIGGGGGSIAGWLADAVGQGGAVLATDLQTSFLEALNKPGLTVKQHDIVSDDLEEAQFDLIHSRAVLEHIPQRDAVLNKILTAVKPGGWVLLEQHDFSSLQHIAGGDADQFASVIQAMLKFLSQNGFDPDYGRKVAHALRLAGLDHVESEARAYELGGDRALTSVLSLVLQRLRPGLVASGLAADEDVGAIAEGLESGEIIAMSPMVVAAWGQKVA